MLIHEGEILWIGPEAERPRGKPARIDRLDGRWITPGLIDCHTHLVFGGVRADEFEMRLKGATYEEIARAGGGIVSSVRKTREATEDQLFASAMSRLEGLKRDGVTTVEIKSGYGLDLETELRMLRVARRLAADRPVEVVTTSTLRSLPSFRAARRHLVSVTRSRP